MTTETIQSKIIETGKRVRADQFGIDVLKGLSLTKKRLSSKYFYDEKGSRLFEEIMNLPEYYLTNAEWEILKRHKNGMLEILGAEPFQLVDLGAGDGAKTRVLLRHFYDSHAYFSYVPIDINRDILEELEEKLAKEMPGMETLPVLAEYFDALKWLRTNRKIRKLVLFLGSNIGNFTKKAAASFLAKMNAAMEDGDLLLIGIDLKKDPRQILHAYDDGKGITSAFNLNLLQRINNELGGDFDLKKWSHFANYSPTTGAVKSYLVSLANQDVNIPAIGKVFHFKRFESVHTEYSYKYSLDEISELATNSGFEPVEDYINTEFGFSDSLWRAKRN